MANSKKTKVNPKQNRVKDLLKRSREMDEMRDDHGQYTIGVREESAKRKHEVQKDRAHHKKKK